MAFCAARVAKGLKQATSNRGAADGVCHAGATFVWANIVAKHDSRVVAVNRLFNIFRVAAQFTLCVREHLSSCYMITVSISLHMI